MKLKALTSIIASAFCAVTSAGEKPSSSEYVSSGLVAHWDGIDNTLSSGVRLHDANATTWVDLTGNGNDITLPSSVTVENNAVYSAASGDYATLASIAGLDASVSGVGVYTVEVVAKRVGWQLEEDNYFGIQTFVRTPRGRFGYREQAANKFVAGFAHDNSQVVWTGVTADGISVADLHTMSFGFGKVKADRIIRINGTAPDTWYPDSNLQYMSPGPWYENYKFFENDRADIRIYAIRIYNRALTDEEREKNLQLDRERFAEVPAFATNTKVRTGYIESDGTQYIKTDYLPNPNTRMELDVMFPGTLDSANGGHRIFGASENSTAINFTANFGNGGPDATQRNINFWMDKGSTPGGKNLQIIFPDSFRKSRHTLTVNAKTGSVTYETTKTDSSRKKTTTHTKNPMALFGSNAEGTVTTFNYSKMRLYGCKIWENDVLVRNFVPWCNPYTGEAGLYDTVGENYFYNGGTGKFAFGEAPSVDLPDGYRQLEYVMALGGQSVATGVDAVSDVSVFMDYEAASTAVGQIVIGARTKAKNEMTASDLFYEVYTGANGKWECCQANGPHHAQTPGGYWSESAIPVDNGQRHELFLDAYRGGFYIDGVCQVNLTHNRNASGSEITLMNAQGSVGTQGKLYSAIMWKAGELVRHFVPCVCEADGTSGLYDLVGNAFYASSGSEDFGIPAGVNFGMPHFFGTHQKDGFLSPINYPVTGNFSFSMWVRNPDGGSFSSDYYNPTKWPHVGVILGQGSIGGEAGFSCYMSNNGEGTIDIKVQVRPGSGDPITVIIPNDKSQVLHDGKWHHVVFSYDYTGSSAKFYIDGKLALNKTDGLVEPANNAGQKLAIGNRGSSMNIPYCGDVAYVSLWNRALAKDDVALLHSRPARVTDQGLMDAWTLDSGDAGLIGIVTGNTLSAAGNYVYQKSKIKWGKLGFSIMLR